MNTETTTDIEKITRRWTRNENPRFTWGEVTGIHTVGEHYTIVEFISRHSKETEFHLYVDDKDMSRSTKTFDEALVNCIALKNLGINEARWMAEAASKLLGV